MNRFTRSLSGLLAFMAIWLAPQNGFGQCAIFSVGPQPVPVTISLDQTTGAATLTSANISAFISGSGPGCNQYLFYDGAVYLGDHVDFDCQNAGTTHAYGVRIWDGSNPASISSPKTILVTVHDDAAPRIFCPNNLTFQTDDDGVSDCQVSAFAPLVSQVVLHEILAPFYATAAGEASDNCSINQFLFKKATGAAAAAGTTAFNPANPSALFPFALGTTFVTFTVKDGANNAATCNFSVTVDDDEPPVLLGTIVDDTINCGDPVPVAGVAATDNCGTTTLTFSQSSGQDPDSTQCGHYTYLITQNWEAEDASGNLANGSRQILVQDTTRPTVNLPLTVLVMTAPLATTCTANVSLFLPADSVYDCAADSLLIISNDAPHGNGRDDASGDYAPGQYAIHFYAEDPCGNVDTSLVTLTVMDGTSPLVACQTSINVSLNNMGQGQIGLYQVLAGLPTDNCTAQNVLLNTATVSPTAFTCANVAAPVTVSLTVTDATGNSTTCTTQVHTQDNTAPTITCPANVAFSCRVDTSMIGHPIASDACTASPIIGFTESTTSNGANCFVSNRIWSATDASGNTAYCAQTITVTDNVAPVLAGVPADTALICGSTIPSATVTASDLCAGSVGVTLTTMTINYDCSQDDYNGHPLKKEVIRTWTAEDACGNSVSMSQSVFFIDTIAPDLSAVPNSMTFPTASNACSANVSYSIVGVTDNCSMPLTISPSAFSVMNVPVGHYTYFFSATDACGNAANDSIIIIVKDTTLPQIICQTSINVTLSNNGYATIPQAAVVLSATDNCGSPAVSLSFTQVSCADASLEALGFGPSLLNVIATDASGNSSTCEVIVHVTAPAGLGVSIDGITTTDPTFFGAADGTAAIDGVSGGSGHYFYGFFDGALTQLNNLPAIGGLESGLFYAGVQDSATQCIDLQGFFLDDGGLPFFQVDSVGGAAGDTICIAVTVENFKNIRSVEMDLSVLDPTVAQVVAVENAQAALFSLAASATNDFTLSMVSTDTISRNLNDGDTLFVIKVRLTGGLGDTTSAVIVDGSIEITTSLTDTIGSEHADGFVAVTSGLPDSEISGRVFPWWNPTIGAGNVAVDLNAGQAVYTTNATGFFSFVTNTAQPVVLRPSKNTNAANGVTVADLFTIQQHILGNPAMRLSGYRQIAADATNDKKISTFDLVNLQYIILNPTASLPNNSSWRFLPTNFVFPDSNNVWLSAFPENRSFILTADTAQNDFVAIKIGDVNRTANPNLLTQSPPVLDRSPMLFSIKDRSIQKGETIDVDLLASGFSSQIGWQMTLGWDAQLLDYQGVTPAAALAMNEKNFGQSEVEKGQLTAAWFASAPKTVADGSRLFSLRFIAKADAPSLEGLLEINSSITPAVAVDALGESPIGLAFESKSAEPSRLETLRIQPNPMTDATVIEYILPTGDGEKAVWTVFDAAGRAVKTAIQTVEKGSNIVRLDRRDLAAAGTYVFEIRTATGVSRKQIVVVD